MHLQRQTQHGFTLVEMIVVMVITGIIGGMLAIFIRAPVQGYVDSSRRAEMTDIADTALRRLARDIRTAVPNSVRVVNSAGTNTYIEFLPTKNGGRYRAGAPGDVLSFGAADGSAEIVGAAITFAAGDYLVIGSTQSSGNPNPPYDPPYNTASTGILRAHDNTKTGSQTKIDFTATALPVWAELQGQRFDVVDGTQQAVTYACIGTLGVLDPNNDGQAQLVRYWHYGFNNPQAAPPLAGPGSGSAVLADKVSACEITYDTVNQRNGLVAMRLGITRGGENISLYHAIHVNNVP